MGNIPTDSIPGLIPGPGSSTGQESTVSVNGRTISVKTGTTHAADPKSTDVQIVKAERIAKGTLETNPDVAGSRPNLAGHSIKPPTETSVGQTATHVTSASGGLRKGMVPEKTLHEEPPQTEDPEEETFSVDEWGAEGSEQIEEANEESDSQEGVLPLDPNSEIRGEQEKALEVAGENEKRVQEGWAPSDEEARSLEVFLGECSTSVQNIFFETMGDMEKVFADPSLSDYQKNKKIYELLKKSKKILPPEVYQRLIKEAGIKFSVNILAIEKGFFGKEKDDDRTIAPKSHGSIREPITAIGIKSSVNKSPQSNEAEKLIETKKKRRQSSDVKRLAREREKKRLAAKQTSNKARKRELTLDEINDEIEGRDQITDEIKRITSKS